MTPTDWIRDYVRECRQVRGTCAEATQALVKAFPYLRRVAGFVFIDWPGKDGITREQHWWTVDEDGNIIDPTVSQFTIPPLRYEQLDLNNEDDRSRVPTGVCMDCGEDVYDYKTFCSAACERSTVAYLNALRHSSW